MRPTGAVPARTLHGSSCAALVCCQTSFKIRIRALHVRGMSSTPVLRVRRGADVLLLSCLSSNLASPAIRHGRLLPVCTLCVSLSAGRRTRGTSRRRIHRPSWRRQVRLSILTTLTARTSAAFRASTKCTWATTKPPRPSVIVPFALSICAADPVCVSVLLSAKVRNCVFPFVSDGVLR
jgi:hypothetical protein